MNLKKLKWKVSHFLTDLKEENHNEEVSYAESRIHERYNLSCPDAMTILSETNVTYDVLNISFGGFASSKVHDNEVIFTGGQKAIIQFMGLQSDAIIHKVYQGRHYIGFRFEHKDANTLIFLREIVENLRIGATMRSLRKEFLTEKYKSDMWICMRGDGPSELEIERNPNGDLIYLQYRFPNSNGINYFFFCNQNCTLKTDNIEIDCPPDIIRYVVNVFLGIGEQEAVKCLRQFYNFVIQNRLVTSADMSSD